MSGFRFAARRACLFIFAIGLMLAGGAVPAFAQKSDVGAGQPAPTTPQFQPPFHKTPEPGEAEDFNYLVSLHDKMLAASDQLANAEKCGSAEDVTNAQELYAYWAKSYADTKKYYIDHYSDTRFAPPADRLRIYNEADRNLLMAVPRASKYTSPPGAACPPETGATTPPAGTAPEPKGSETKPPCDDGSAAAKIAEAEDELSRRTAARDRIKRVMDNDKSQLDTAIKAFGAHDARTEALRKTLDSDDASLKTAETRIADTKARIEALRALKPCRDQGGTTPQPPATPGPTPPGATGLPPCDDGTLAKKIADAESALRVETESLQRMDERLHNDIHALNVARDAFGEDSPQYEKLNHNYSVDLDKWSRIHARQENARTLLERLRALKTCRKPKHHHAVTEDDPRYMEDYQPPATTPKPHENSSHASRPPYEPPPEDDGTEHDHPHNPYDQVPDVPMGMPPHGP